MVLSIIIFCLSIIVYLLGGFVCGRICVDIIRDKNKQMNEVMWFWVGFMFSWAGILLTLVVKEKKN